MTWAQRLKRVFATEGAACGPKNVRSVVDSFGSLSMRRTVQTLKHLGLISQRTH